MAELTKARDDSNVISGSGNKGKPGTGNAAKDGFTAVDYPSQGPAAMQSQVSGVGESVGSLGNDGTSAGAYKDQGKDLKIDGSV